MAPPPMTPAEATRDHGWADDCAPGRTRTHDPLLRSKHGSSAVLTCGFAGQRASEDAQLSASLLWLDNRW
jgi:hypothetical protein